MAQDNITRLRILMQKFHTPKKLTLTDEQLKIIYEFLFEKKFYPIKESFVARQSVIRTILYLHDMVNRDGYNTLDLLEHYYKRQRTRVSNMFKNLKNDE